MVDFSKRVYALKNPIETLISKNDSARLNTKLASLNMLLALVGEIRNFVSKYNKQSIFNKIKHVAFMNSYASELTSLNLRLSQCTTDLSLGITVDMNQNRA